MTETLPPCSTSSSSPSSPGLQARGEEHWAEADREVLMRHPVERAEGRNQAEVVEQQRQGCLGKEKVI